MNRLISTLFASALALGVVSDAEARGDNVAAFVGGMVVGGVLFGGPGYYYPYPYYGPIYYQPPMYYYPPVQMVPFPVQQAPAPQQYWYYCPSSNGYYPHVRECPEWQRVPAQPPQ